MTSADSKSPSSYPRGPVSPGEVQSIAGRVDLNALNGQSILITGSSGLMGNYLAHTIFEVMGVQGYRPKELILQSRSAMSKQQAWTAASSRIKMLTLNLDFTEVFPQCEALIHAASPASPSQYGTPADVWTPNISGVVSTLSMSPNPTRVLYISTGEIYQHYTSTSKSMDRAASFRSSSERSTYPNAKFAGEQLLLSSEGGRSGRFKIARLFHTFGAGFKADDGRSFADFFSSAIRREPIRLYSAGTDKRNFSYIEDSISGLLSILVSNTNQTIFDVGGEERLSIRQFAEMVATQANVELVIQDESVRGSRQEIFGSPPPPQLDSLRSLGWKPKVAIYDGIFRTLETLKASSL